jgi:hypothetical protein
MPGPGFSRGQDLYRYGLGTIRAMAYRPSLGHTPCFDNANQSGYPQSDHSLRHPYRRALI